MPATLARISMIIFFILFALLAYKVAVPMGEVLEAIAAIFSAIFLIANK